jgi:hypothetical protein
MDLGPVYSRIMTLRTGEQAEARHCTRCDTWWLWLPWPVAEPDQDGPGCPTCLPFPADERSAPPLGPESAHRPPGGPAGPDAAGPDAAGADVEDPVEPEAVKDPFVTAGTDAPRLHAGTDPAARAAIRIVYPADPAPPGLDRLSTVYVRIVDGNHRPQVLRFAEFARIADLEAPAATSSPEDVDAVEEALRPYTPGGKGTPRPPGAALWGPVGCEVLATIADILDAVRNWVARAAGRTVEILLSGTGEPGRVVGLIGRLVEETVKAGLKPVNNLANALRVAGVGLCVLDGAPLGQCRCVHGLVTSVTRQAVIGGAASLINEALGFDASSPAERAADRRQTGIFVGVAWSYLDDWADRQSHGKPPHVPPSFQDHTRHPAAPRFTATPRPEEPAAQRFGAAPPPAEPAAPRFTATPRPEEPAAHRFDPAPHSEVPSVRSASRQPAEPPTAAPSPSPRPAPRAPHAPDRIDAAPTPRPQRPNTPVPPTADSPTGTSLRPAPPAPRSPKAVAAPAAAPPLPPSIIQPTGRHTDQPSGRLSAPPAMPAPNLLGTALPLPPTTPPQPALDDLPDLEPPGPAELPKPAPPVLPVVPPPTSSIEREEVRHPGSGAFDL